MSQSPSPEEILERMRTQVSRRTVGSQTSIESQPGAANDRASQTGAALDWGATGSSLLQSADFCPLQREIETALEGTRQVGQLNPRNPGLSNAAIQFVKKLMSRSLSWYTRPLHHFQGGVVRALQHILVLLEGQQESLQKGLREGSTYRAAIDEMQSDLGRVKNDLREAKFQIRLRDRDIRRFFHDIQIGTLALSAEANPSPTPPMFPSGGKSDSEFDKFHFEELYRGDETLVTTHQKQYLGLFRGREDVLDAGCGRGEFLELLRDNGVRAKGVETGTDQYLLCREKALEVVQQDPLSYLESLPDQALGGLFSAQVIQYLTASDQLRFVSLAYRKTRPESPVVLETINAQCVFAVMRSFFLDPMLVRTAHPETLKFAMESVGFHDVEIRFSGPMSERQIPPLKLNGNTPQLAEFNHAIAELNELMYGDMDYAAIGWR